MARWKIHIKETCNIQITKHTTKESQFSTTNDKFKCFVKIYAHQSTHHYLYLNENEKKIEGNGALLDMYHWNLVIFKDKSLPTCLYRITCNNFKLDVVSVILGPIWVWVS